MNSVAEANGIWQEVPCEDLSEEIKNEAVEGQERRAIQIREQDIPHHILEHVRNNSPSSGLFLANDLVFICPWLLTAPFLGFLGFGAAGPVAGKFPNVHFSITDMPLLIASFSVGSIASWIQSIISPVAGGSLFAILQSAGMGGFGATVVNGVVAAGGAVRMAIAAIFNFFRRR